jgi:hypothetical protein
MTTVIVKNDPGYWCFFAYYFTLLLSKERGKGYDEKE